MSEVLGRPGIYLSPEKPSGGGRQENGGDIFERLLSERGDREFYVDSNLSKIVNNLATLQKETPIEGEKIPGKLDKEKSEARKELGENWEGLMYSSLIQTEDVLDNQLLRFKNPYPYDHRKRADWFESVEDALDKTRNSKLGHNEEAGAWLDRIKEDIHWGKHNLELLVSMGAGVENFHDGKKMLGWLGNMRRVDAVAANYEGVFAKDIPGLTITDAQKSLLTDKAKEGFREKAVRFQDESLYWRMAVSTIHQEDPDDPGAEPLLKKMTPVEKDFVKALFALKDKSNDGFVDYKGKKVPESVLNWYNMASKEDLKRKYIALNQALLLENAREELKRIQKEGVDGSTIADKTEMDSLIGKVKARAEDIIQSWNTAAKPLDQKLASVVVKSGIVYDWGHMNSADMSWGFDYTIEDDGTVKKTCSTGGTTTATDSNTPRFWLFSEIGTQMKDWTHGIIPSVDRYKPGKDPVGTKRFAEISREHRPDWKPSLSEWGGKDREFPRLWNSFKSNPIWTTEDGKKVWPWIEKMTWAYVTKTKDGGGNPVVLPIMFSPTLDISFFDSFTLEKGGKLQGEIDPTTGKIITKSNSVWEELRQGKDLSEIQWENMSDQMFNRWLINLSQKLKYYTTMSESPSRMNEDMFLSLFGDSGQINELKKRVDLGERDERVPVNIFALTFIPLMVAMQTAKQSKISGSFGELKDVRTKWIEVCAGWLDELDGLKDKKYPNYGKMMAETFKFYVSIFARYGALTARGKAMDEQEKFKDLKRVLDSQSFGIDTSIMDANLTPRAKQEKSEKR